MSNNKWYKLSRDAQEHWESEARKVIYPDLTPYSDEKEAQVRPLARELYYKSLSTVQADQ